MFPVQSPGLYCHILKYFKHCNLNKAQIVAQSYDGANVMAGKFNGIQAKIKKHLSLCYIYTLHGTKDEPSNNGYV